MSKLFSIDAFKVMIENDLKDEIEVIVCEKIEEAKFEIEKQIKSITGRIAAQVLGQFSFRINEYEMVIHVNTKDLNLTKDTAK